MMAYSNNTITTKKMRKRPNEIVMTVYGPQNDAAMVTAKGLPRTRSIQRSTITGKGAGCLTVGPRGPDYGRDKAQDAMKT